MGRTHRYSRSWVLALIIALLAACGGGSGSNKADPKTYVHDVCGAVLDWVNAAKAGSSQLQQLGAGTASIGDRKAALAKYVADLVDKTDTALSKLRDAGVPDVSGGEHVSGALVDAFEKVRDTFVRAKDTVAALPTSSAAAFQAAAGQFGASLQSSLQGVGSSLSSIGEDPALVKASDGDPSCQQLGNS